MAKDLRKVLAYDKIVAMNKPTRTYLLIEERLGKNLRRYVSRCWHQGGSWNSIARDLNAKTEVAVTSETLRLWFYDLRPENRKRDAA